MGRARCDRRRAAALSFRLTHIGRLSFYMLPRVAPVAAMIVGRSTCRRAPRPVQAALDLLHRTEADADVCIEARRTLLELRRAAVAPAGKIIDDALAAEGGFIACKLVGVFGLS